MKPIKNMDFFKSNQTAIAEATVEPVVKKEKVAPLRVSRETVETLKKMEKVFLENNLKKPAKKISAVCKQASREKFSVAVVGEFSKGKSSFINKLLDKDFLPVGDLPTTAIMTRIRNNRADTMVLVDEKGKKVKTMPVKASSWENLTADNFSDNDPKGIMYVGLNDSWLENNSLEIIDTPGAGDLEEKRAKVIGDALVGCDGAIITISALGALSMSEKLFIEQRLISRKTPFLMLIVTKLDLVPINERAAVIEYIKQRLEMWGMNIPVYVPYEVEMPVDTYNNIVGMDKVKDEIERWVRNPERVKLTETWLLARAMQVVEDEIACLNEQLVLLKVDDKKREELITEKKRLLFDAKIAWEEARLNLLEKCNDCYSLFMSVVEESKTSIVERLQYESSHSNNLQKWWTEDYPYRLKIELTNMAVNVENAVSRRFSDDARWFNKQLEQQFKSHVIYENERITDKTFFNSASINSIELEDLNKKRMVARVGTTIVSLALYPICASFGFMPIIATMGVGTGSSIITEKVFGNKIEQQRKIVKDAIAVNVQQMVEDSIKDSENRLRKVYDDIIQSAVEKENEWLEAQYTAIENSVNAQGDQQKAKVEGLINALMEITK